MSHRALEVLFGEEPPKGSNRQEMLIVNMT